jgi:dUTP pyrophosphatase
MVHTGIAAEIPDGYEIQVRPRSGLACKGVTVWNSPGTVDSKYRGEICVILMYINNECEPTTNFKGETIGVHLKDRYIVEAGDKIAQLVLAPVTFADPYEVQELSETDRGTGGFGSTGR